MFSVVLDTYVLYPAYLRDVLLRTAAAGLYRPLLSADILDELRSNVGNLIGQDKADRIVELIETHFEDAVVTGYEPLLEAMTNQPKDRHVLAAAVRSNAGAIVTFNSGDFPVAATEPYRIDVIHPDLFLLDLLDLAPGAFMGVLERMVAGYRDPAMDIAQLAGRLAAGGCLQTAEQIHHHLQPDPS